MKEEKFEKLMRYAKGEERERCIGVIEFYISELGDTPGEKVAKRMLDAVKKTIESAR